MNLNNLLRLIFKYLFTREPSKAIEYSGYSLEELDLELGYQPFDIVIAKLREHFDPEVYKQLLRRIYSKKFEIPYREVVWEEINQMLSEHPIFKGRYNPRIPFDKKFAEIPVDVALSLLDVLLENIEPYHGVSDLAFTITAYNQIVTGLNWIGSATGIRHFDDGKEDEITFNVMLIVDKGETKLMFYEPDTRNISLDGKGPNYYIYSGGIIVWG